MLNPAHKKLYILMIATIVVAIGSLSVGTKLLRGLIINAPDTAPPSFDLPDNPADQDQIFSDTVLKIVDHEVEDSIFDPRDDQKAIINFTINKAADVTLAIYDQDDEEVVTLIDDRNYKKGEYTMKWNGEDMFGDIVDDDEYEYRLSVRDENDSDRAKGRIFVNRGYEQDEEETADPRLKNVYVTKDEFDPGLEKNYLVFTLTADADVRGQLLDNHGNEIYEFTNEDGLTAGTYAIKLDESELSGNGNTPITYHLSAQNGRYNDEQEGTVRIKEEDENTSSKPNIFKDYSDGIPFQPSGQNRMSVSFKIDREAEMTLEIRDGDFVVNTVTEDMELPEGSHTLYWDGTDSDGDMVSSGVYQYKLIAANNRGRDTEKGNFSVETTGKGGLGTLENCGGFNDVGREYHYCEAVKWAKDQGIVEGFGDGSFKPDEPVTRAQAVKMILETFKVNMVEGRGQNLGFSDVSRYLWYTDYIKTALSLGIVHGYQDGTFRPDQFVLRAEGYIILLNTARVKDNVVIPTQLYGQPYYDVPNNQSTRWFITEAWFAKEHQLTDSEDYFYPLDNMSRGEMADMLYRYDKAGL